MGDDLEAMRAKRMEELQQQYGGQMGGPGGAAQQQKQEEDRQKEMEMKNSMLSQILSQEARARLNSIALVKPEKAKAVEQMLIQMARSGQITSKLSESGLVGLLDKVNQQIQKTTTVKFDRRRAQFDSDDEDYLQ